MITSIKKLINGFTFSYLPNIFSSLNLHIIGESKMVLNSYDKHHYQIIGQVYKFNNRSRDSIILEMTML